jgi:hypothetical protein
VDAGLLRDEHGQVLAVALIPVVALRNSKATLKATTLYPGAAGFDLTTHSSSLLVGMRRRLH